MLDSLAHVDAGGEAMASRDPFGGRPQRQSRWAPWVAAVALARCRWRQFGELAPVRAQLPGAHGEMSMLRPETCRSRLTARSPRLLRFS